MTHITQAQLDEWKRDAQTGWGIDPASRILALISALEESREALKPFAEKAKIYDVRMYDKLADVHQKMSFTINDLRRAAKAKAKAEGVT